MQTLLFPGNHPEVVKDVLFRRKVFQDQIDPSILTNTFFIWSPIDFSKKFYQLIDSENASRTEKPHIVINHIHSLNGITVKSQLIKSLKKFYGIYPLSVDSKYSVFHTTPTTFIISEDNTSEYFHFVQRYRSISNKDYHKELTPSKHCEKNLWIVKPHSLNQGRGIEIFNNLYEIQEFLNDRRSVYVVQKYLEKPMLYYNRKFDIRVWCLITCEGDVYFYKYGYIRTSSEDFNLSHNAKYVHLTNNCFQCNGEKYGKFEEGNTLSFEKFNEYLSSIYPGATLETHILPRIKDLMIDCFMSVMRDINSNKRQNCFELLGYDFMIDEDLRVWLIECNENPYIGLPNAYIKEMLPRMLNNMLRIVLDPHVPPKEDPYKGIQII
jgi:hypothetical protein